MEKPKGQRGCLEDKQLDLKHKTSHLQDKFNLIVIHLRDFGSLLNITPPRVGREIPDSKPL